MSRQQPEPLRLAAALGRLAGRGPNWQVLDSAASELRRLHAEKTALLKALKELDEKPDYTSAWIKARAIVAKVEGGAT